MGAPFTEEQRATQRAAVLAAHRSNTYTSRSAAAEAMASRHRTSIPTMLKRLEEAEAEDRERARKLRAPVLVTKIVPEVAVSETPADSHTVIVDNGSTTVGSTVLEALEADNAELTNQLADANRDKDQLATQLKALQVKDQRTWLNNLQPIVGLVAQLPEADTSRIRIERLDQVIRMFGLLAEIESGAVMEIEPR